MIRLFPLVALLLALAAHADEPLKEDLSRSTVIRLAPQAKAPARALTYRLMPDPSEEVDDDVHRVSYVIKDRTGLVIGKTDEFGFGITEQPVHVHDLNATVLNLLGIDHERLTFKYQGREFRLTDIGGHVMKEWMA